MTLSIRQIMTDEEFYYFCQENSDHKFEREPDGLTIVMPNTGGKTRIGNSTLTCTGYCLERNELFRRSLRLIDRVPITRWQHPFTRRGLDQS